MAGPWENYQSGDSQPVASGPWSNYQPAQAPAPQPTDALQGFTNGATAPFKPIVNDTLEALKNAATSTGQAISEPLNNPNANGAIAIPDAIMRTLGKAGNVIGGTFGALTSPLQGALTASTEPFIQGEANAIKSLVPDDTRFNANLSPEIIHKLAQQQGGDLSNAVMMGMAANQGVPPTGKPIGPTVGDVFPPDSSAVAASEAAAVPASVLSTDGGKPLAVAPKVIQQGGSDLGEFLAKDGIDLNKVADQLEAAQKIDPKVSALDIITQGEGDIPSGSNALGLAQSIAQSPGQGRTMASELVLRGKAATADIGDLFDKSLSTADYYQGKQQLADAMKASGQAYDKAYANPVAMDSPQINDLLSRPAGQAALDDAKTLAANEGTTILTPDGALNTQGVDYVKRALDDMINGQEGKTQFGKTTQAGKGYLAIKNGILGEADRLNPDFAAARAEFADPASQMEALEQGKAFSKMNSGEIADFMGSKSPAEKMQFANGVNQALQDKLNAVQDGSNPIKKIWTEATREKLRPLFASDDDFNRLARGMELHKARMNVDQIVQGSPTFRNEQFDKAPVKTMTGHAIRLASDPLSAAGNMLGNIADAALTKRAKAMSEGSKTVAMRYLTTKDPEALRYLATQIAPKPSAKLPLAVAAGAAPFLAAALAHRPHSITGPVPQPIAPQPTARQPQANATPTPLLSRIAQAESGGNPNAKNPNSTASGPLQFTNKTWADMVARYGKQTGITLAQKNDPQAQATMGQLLAADNARIMTSKLGRPPTDGELYAAHFFGRPTW